MKTLKNHWPAILMILLTVGSIVSFQWALKNDGDLLSLSIFYFGLLVSACALVLCLWYWIRLDDRRKWLLPVACWAAPILMETISCLDGLAAGSVLFLCRALRHPGRRRDPRDPREEPRRIGERWHQVSR